MTLHPAELLTYEMDAGLGRGAPDAVVFPESTEDVVRLVRWASAERVPIVPRSAGTGLSGGAVPSHGGIVVSFSRMNRVLELNEQARVAVVEPGLINLTLDGLVKKRGLYYPPDPASQRASSIGGNIAENAGGPHCFKYGVTTNYIQDLELVLANGQLAHTAGRACDYPGYDFTGLLTGSEGTLGVITSATLRLVRNPPGVKTLTATFDSIESAGQAVSGIIAAGLVPAALEMMDKNILGIIEAFVHAGLPTDTAAMLLLEVDGYPESLDAQMAEIVDVLKKHSAIDLHVCSAPEREKIWTARKSAFGAMARLSPAYFQVDGTVPRTKLALTLAAIRKLCDDQGLRVAFVFHAGDGNLHPLIPFDPADEAMTKKVYQVGRDFLALCVKQDGTISGEHGVGMEKREFMDWMYSAAELKAMRDVKQVFDPEDLLNPGKIFPDTLQRSADPESNTEVDEFGDFVAPQSDAEAVLVLQCAQTTGRAVLLRGGGTQSAPPATGGEQCASALILSTLNMKGICDYAPRDLYVTVRAGTPLLELEQNLSADHLWVPIVAPREASTIGGIISTGLNSPLRMRYGSVRDQVLGVRVVLPEGRRVRFGRPVVKNVAGHDMVKLFVGAQGTLGLITEVTLRLVATPRVRRTLLVPLANLDEGIRAAQQVLPLALVASSILLVKNEKDDGRLPGFNWLAFTAEGYGEDVEAELYAVEGVLERHSVSKPAKSEMVTGLDLWVDLIARYPSHLRLGLPRESVLSFLQANGNALGEFVADVASGLIYSPTPSPGDLSELRRLAHSAGGYATITAARGVGGFDPWGYVPDLLPQMKMLKSRWDPTGCLNKECLWSEQGH